MTPDELAALASDVAGRAWAPGQLALAERFAGRTVYIIGPGVSALKFPAPPEQLTIDALNGDELTRRLACIVCDSAVKIFPSADAWLAAGYGVHLAPWFDGGRDFRGIPVIDAGITRQSPTKGAVTPGMFPEGFWARTVWFERYALAYNAHSNLPSVWEHDFRAPHGGLAAIVDPSSGYDAAVLSSPCAAAHAALLGGAARLIFYGCEFTLEEWEHFPVNWDAPTGGGAGATATGDGLPVGVWIYNGEPLLYPGAHEAHLAPQAGVIDGKKVEVQVYRTTRLLLAGSLALRALLDRAAELSPPLEWEDRSGGLLRPELMKAYTEGW